MTELRDPQPLSRIELVVLGRLNAAKGATETEIAESLRELGMPLAESALVDCVTAALASLGSRALAAGPPEPRQPSSPKSGGKPKSKQPKSPASTKKPSVARFTLTEKGRLALGEAFGLPAAPPWKDMCNGIVPALALGEPPGSEGAVAALRSADAMIATLLRRDRSLGEVASVAELCDRIISRALGMPPGPVTPAGIRAYALAMYCGVNSKAEIEAIATSFAPTTARAAKGTKRPKGAKQPTPEAALTELGKQLAKTQFGVEIDVKATTAAATKKALTQSLQRRWASHQDESDDAQRPSAVRSAPIHPPPMPAELAPLPSPVASGSDAAETLLTAVRHAIPMVGSAGRYGKDNVFVSALWQQVARDHRLSELSLDGFKNWLVTANRNQQLALARADMVDDMDARLVEASEINYLGATFHFVLDRRDSASASWQVHHGR